MTIPHAVPFDANFQSHSSLPPFRNLCIATRNSIHLHTRTSQTRLFECENDDGILNARAARDNSGLLAAADGQVVVLVDVGRGVERERKWRLKGGDGDPRLLLFDPTSRILYFTTTLSPCIQAYSIPTARLLPPLQAHPSPPTVLAIAAKGEVLMSASANPPIVFLQDMRGGEGGGRGVPLEFWPRHARAPVACAAFRSFAREEWDEQASCVFALGFQDGMLAVYRLSLPALPGVSLRGSGFGSGSVAGLSGHQLRRPSKLGYIRKLHKAAMGGVCAAEFLPGYKLRVVSVGFDGRCRLVDFEDGGGKVLRTWYVSGPASCLAITSIDGINSRGRRERDVIFSGDATDEEDGEEQEEREENDQIYEGIETLIAIGTQTGKVLIFNVLGLQIHEIAVQAPVVAVEWVGDMSAPSTLPKHRPMSPMSGMESPISPPRPVLDMLMDDYTRAWGEEQEQGEDGTVRRKSSPAKDSRVKSPILFGPSRDLFSFASPDIPRRPSDISYGSPEPRGRVSNKYRKKTHPRPRIVTETFKSPDPCTPTTSASLQSVSPAPMSSVDLDTPPLSSPTELQIQETRQWSQVSRRPSSKLNGPIMSGVMGFDAHISDTRLEREREGEAENAEMDIWMTPPTSHQQWQGSLVGVVSPRQRSSALGTRSIDPEHARKIADEGPVTPPVTPQRRAVRRRISWGMRSSPKAVDTPESQRTILDNGSRHRSGLSLHRSSFLASSSPSRQDFHRPKKRIRVDSRARPERLGRIVGDVDGDGRRKREELSARADSEMLRREMEGLRMEVRALTEVVLARKRC
ncbi:hypothetical protein P154DRAFT_563479 [Amniculicola lignicola CBS 123094]|uniref:WD40 repeat-like protein n=1 Tax=Amniculicola lignicola CBS 123094 TaxID=1392246 RepID=A0A6A5WHA0_9PLEO|nr:hypothetical protein P154DRAFT_563479 [Amniculicola lignicola CBS 123094]